MPRLRLSLCLVLPLLVVTQGAQAERTPPSPNVIVVTAPRPLVTRHVERTRHSRSHHAERRTRKCGKRGPASAYSASSGVAFEGQIDKVTFQPDRTILVVRDRGGETCAYLPPRAELSKHGIPPALLQRKTPVVIEGFAHRTDKHKVLVQELIAHPRG